MREEGKQKRKIEEIMDLGVIKLEQQKSDGETNKETGQTDRKRDRRLDRYADRQTNIQIESRETGEKRVRGHQWSTILLPCFGDSTQ